MAPSPTVLERPATQPTTVLPPPALGGLGALIWRWGPVSLVATVILTRLPLATRTLYAFDSANYALAVRDYYNVAHHQPHPPGYPLYVALAWLINLLVRDANRSLIVEGVLLSAVAVACTIGVARALYGRAAGLLAGTLLVFTVGFWGYGEVAYPYVGLAAEVAAIALLAHATMAGHRRLVLALGAVWGIALGIRWDGAIFGSLLWLWALWHVPWRWRLGSVALAAAITVAWAVPMVQLTGGLTVYLQAIDDYLHVWGPQSAFVVGDVQTGGERQATYNLNFFVNYVRQMLGIGVVLVLYVVGKRFGPAPLATDYRSRFLLLWTLPPIGVYLLSHLGEPGYVLSLAPQAATLAAVAIVDLRDEGATLGASLRARGWRWVPPARWLGGGLAAGLTVAIVGWNVQAFVRGVGPGRLPDLRAHDATTTAQVAFLGGQPTGATLILTHDILRQVQFYLPGRPVTLLYSEYVPGWQSARTRTELPPGTTQVVVLDSPLRVPAVDMPRLHEVVVLDQPRVTVWVLDTQGASAVEHGYQFVQVVAK